MCHLVFTQHHVYDIHIMALTIVVDVELVGSAKLGPQWVAFYISMRGIF